MRWPAFPGETVTLPATEKGQKEEAFLRNSRRACTSRGAERPGLGSGGGRGTKSQVCASQPALSFVSPAPPWSLCARELETRSLVITLRDTQSCFQQR